MTERILHVVDDSNAFMKAGSDLPVGENQEGAEELIEATNNFFAQIPPDSIDMALFTLDTHFSVEYDLSPEAQAFGLHCEYGTDGWALAVDPERLDGTIPVYYMTKNTFDFWGDNPVPEADLLAHHGVETFDELPFNSDEERQAYKNLHRVVANDPTCLSTEGTVDRDIAMDDLEDTEVVVIGVASNFCDADAMFGYLERGAKVVVMEDLVKGIPLGAEGRKMLLELTGIDRTEGGTMQEVFETDRFAPYVQSGQLRLARSGDYILELRAAVGLDMDGLSGGPA